MKISIVIPNYNGKKLLEKNLPAILGAVKEAEIIVVDDASTDESREFLRENYPQVRIIAKKKNEGFAASVNSGVRETKGDLIILLNSDVAPQEDFLHSLLPHFEDEKMFAVTCLEKSIEEDKTVLRGRGVGYFHRGFLIHRRGEVDKANTLWAGGGASMFRKNIWEKLGGLDTLYNPFYWEDIDLSYRAVKSGYTITFESKSIVVHTHSEGAIKKRYSPAEIKTIAYRNQIIFVWLNITDIRFIIEHILFIPFHIARAIISADTSFLKGFLLALSLLPSVFRKRNTNQKKTKLTDREVLQNVMLQ